MEKSPVYASIISKFYTNDLKQKRHFVNTSDGELSAVPAKPPPPARFYRRSILFTQKMKNIKQF